MSKGHTKVGAPAATTTAPHTQTRRAMDQATIAGREAIIQTEVTVSQTTPVAETMAAAVEGGRMTLALLAIIQTEVTVSQTTTTRQSGIGYEIPASLWGESDSPDSYSIPSCSTRSSNWRQSILGCSTSSSRGWPLSPCY